MKGYIVEIISSSVKRNKEETEFKVETDLKIYQNWAEEIKINQLVLKLIMCPLWCCTAKPVVET